MFFKYNYPALLWATFIAVLCGIPGQDLPSADWLELISFDKFVHAGMFAALVFLTVRGFRKQSSTSFLNRYAAYVAVSFAIAYGGILEILQGALFENRTADVYDFIANTVGCLVGLWLVMKPKNKTANN